MSTIIVAYDGRNTEDESYRCKVAEVVITKFNNKIPSDYRCELSYDNSNRVAVDDRDFNRRPDISSIITDQVNFLFTLEDNRLDNDTERDSFVTPYLEFIKERYFSEKADSEKEIIKTLFYNLDFEGYFSKASSEAFKETLNSYFV